MTRLNPVCIVLFAAALLLSSCGAQTRGTASGPASQTPGQLSTETAGPALPDGMAPVQPPIETANLRPVKVGILLPLSGEHQQLGQSMLKAAQMALFDVGYEGFELIPRDTKNTPQDAQEAARSAIQDGAELLLGPIFSEAVAAVKPIAAQSNINLIAFTTDWKQAGNNTYLMGFMPFDQVERVTRYAATQGIKTMGVIAPTSDYGQIAVSAIDSATSRAGLHTTELTRFNPQTREMAATIRAFTHFDQRHAPGQTYNPVLPYDAVFMPVGGDSAKIIANMMTQFDMPPNKVRRIGTGLFDDDTLTREGGLEGAWFAAPSPNARDAFERRFSQSYGYAAPRLSTLAYDATALAAILAKRGLSGPDKRPGFDRQSLMNPNGFAGIDGIFRFRNDGTAERGLAILEIHRAGITIVEDAPRTFQTPATQ